MEQRDFWIVTGNTDDIEGKGDIVRLGFAECYATALRLAKGKGPMGTDAIVSKCTLFKPDGKSVWYGPVDVEKPTAQDNAHQSVIDARETALRKARDLGLTESEIRMIQKAT